VCEQIHCWTRGVSIFFATL